jgi:hypothetical protein
MWKLKMLRLFSKMLFKANNSKKNIHRNANHRRQMTSQSNDVATCEIETLLIKVVWVWDQSNGKQMILISMDTHMYKQCIIMKLKKRV